MTDDDAEMMLPPELAARWRTTEGRLAMMRYRKTGPRFVKLGNSRNSRIFYPREAVLEYEAQMTVATSLGRPKRNDDA